MDRTGVPSVANESADRGVSPQMGIVVLFGLVVVGGILIFGVGIDALNAVQTEASAERSEQMMHQFDDDLQTSLLDDSTSGSVYIDGNGEYDVVTDGQIEIVAANEYASKRTEIPMGTLRYEDESGNVFAHQAGGIWRGDGDDAKVVSAPNLQYSERSNSSEGQVSLSVTNLMGNIQPGENNVAERPESGGQTGDLSRDIGFVNHIEITVSDSSYHYAWADYLQEEFGAELQDDPDECDIDDRPDETIICHDEPAESVTVIAPIEEENEFGKHVGIDSTVYGGFYVDGDQPTVNNPVTVDRYNGSDDDGNDGNVTEDLFVAYDGLQLGPDANITGVPVVNGALTGEIGAVTSSIAFATDPGGQWYREIEGTAVYNVTESEPPEVFGAQMSRSFSKIDPIDRQVDRAIGLVDDNLDEGHENRGINGNFGIGSDEEEFYYDDDDTVTLRGTKIDTGGHNDSVHVAIDGDLDLKNVDITGDGRAYFYVSGDITARNVNIEGDDARKLWVYGTSDADVTVRDVSAQDKFQGVIYAPGSDELTLEEDTEVYGAIVGGGNDEVDIGEDVSVHFDERLRTDVPIPEENMDVSVELTQRRSPLDVTFVLDRSGSMSSNDPERKRVDATKKFLGLMKGKDSDVLEGDQGDQAGVYEFNAGGYEIHQLSDDLESVSQSITTAEQGNTDMSAGMKPALDEYELRGSDSANRHMILLSDGENTVQSTECVEQGSFFGIPICIEWETTSHSDEETLAQAQRAADMNVTIHTIGLGDEIDVDMLVNIANMTDGGYYTADDNDELEEIFEGIADDVTAEPPTTFTVSSIDEPTTHPSDYAVEVRERPIQIGG